MIQPCVISAYQGVGKSTLARKHPNLYIDLESSNYDKSDPTWALKYVNDAMSLIAKTGKTIFLSSHLVVRETLRALAVRYYCIVPHETLQAKWTSMLKFRHSQTNLDKDYRAYMDALDNFVETVKLFNKQEKGCVYVIRDMKYNLEQIIKDFLS